MAQLQDKSLTEFFYAGIKLTSEDGEIVYESEASREMIFFLEEGYLKSYTLTSEGDTNILNFYGPGSIFPLGPSLRKSVGNRKSYRIQTTVYFECITDAIIYKRTVSDFFALIEKKPEIYQELVYRLLQNYEMYLSSAEAMRFRYARKRVVHQLLVLTNRFGSSDEEGGTIIELPLTHQDFSDNIGMARETVTRELENLRQDGYIETKDHHIIIYNLENLYELLETS